jgi:hypothetical protein
VQNKHSYSKAVYEFIKTVKNIIAAGINDREILKTKNHQFIGGF